MTKTKISKDILIAQMSALANDIGYEPKNLNYLIKAMNCTKVDNQDDDGDSHTEYINQSMATLGDSIINFILCEHGYKEKLRMKEITKIKQKYATNIYFKSITDKLDLKKYAYNENYFYYDAPDNEKVSVNKHDNLIEAITAAIYLDRGLRFTKKILKKLLREDKLK